jgi:hypothetical protein
MSEEPQRAVGERANRASRDGLAALAITLLAVALITWVIINLI